jgi:chromosome segregation ATPase
MKTRLETTNTTSMSSEKVLLYHPVGNKEFTLEKSKSESNIQEFFEFEEAEEPKANIFLDSTLNKRKEITLRESSNSKPYQQNLLLDLRLQIDKLSGEKLEMEELFQKRVSELESGLEVCHCQNFILKVENIRLGIKLDDMGAHINELEKEEQKLHNEDTDKKNYESRKAELESQLESLLSVNQKNLENLKFKRLSLEKLRRKFDSIAAENVLLKMSLQMFASAERNDQGNTCSGEEYNELKKAHEGLQEKYRYLVKQNMEQEEFAKILDSKVTEMTVIVRESKLKDGHIASLKDEVEKLRIANKEKERSQPRSRSLNGFKEVNRTESGGNKAEIAKDESETLAGLAVSRKLLEELRLVFEPPSRQSPAYYECEMIRIKIQSLLRNLESILETQTKLNETSQTLMQINSMISDHTPSLDSYLSDISQLFVIVGQTLGSLWSITDENQKILNQNNSNQKSRSESKAIRVGDNSKSEEDILNKLNSMRMENTELKNKIQMLNMRMVEMMKREDEEGNSDVLEMNSFRASQIQIQLRSSNKQVEQLTLINEGLRNQLDELMESKDLLRAECSKLGNKLEHEIEEAAKNPQLEHRLRQDLEAQLAEMNQERKGLKDQVKELECTVKDKSKEIKSISSEMMTLRRENESKTAEMKEAEAQLESFKKSILHEYQLLKTENSELNGQIEKWREFEKNVREMIQKKELVTAETENELALKRSEVKELTDELQTLEGQMNHLQRETSKTVQNLKEEVENKLAIISRLEENIRTITKEGGDIGEVQRQLSSKVKQNDTLAQNIEELENKLEELMETKAQNEHIQEELKNTIIDPLVKENQELRDHVTHMKKQVSEGLSRFQAEAIKMKNFNEGLVHEHEKEKSRLLKEISSLREMKTDQGTSRQDSEALKELRAKNKDLQRIIEDQQSELESLSKEAFRMRNEAGKETGYGSIGGRTHDIEDMRMFVKSMKQANGYSSNLSAQSEHPASLEQINDELRQKNAHLLEKVFQFEQARNFESQDANSKELEELRAHNEELEKQIQKLQREMRDMENTCKHMRDKLMNSQNGQKKDDKVNSSGDEDYYLSRPNEEDGSQATQSNLELKHKLEEEEKKRRELHEKFSNKLAENLDLNKHVQHLKSKLQEAESKLRRSIEPNVMKKILVKICSEISNVKAELNNVRRDSKETNKQFAKNIFSLIALFDSDAEIAPKGTLDKIIQLSHKENKAKGSKDEIERRDDFIRNLSKEKEDLRDQNNRLEYELESKKKKITDLMGSLADLEMENSSKEKNIKSLKKEIVSLEDKISSAKSNHREESGKEQKVSYLETQLKESTQRERILKKEIEEIHKELKNLETQNEYLSKSLTQATQSRSQEEEASRQTLEKYKGKINSQEAKLQHALAKLAEIGDSTNQEVEELLRGKEESMELITQLTLRMNELEMRNQELEENLAELVKEVKSKKRLVKELQMEIGDKENIKVNENHSQEKQHEFEHQVTVLIEKYNQKSKECEGWKKKCQATGQWSESHKLNDSDPKKNDRVTIIRAKIELLFEKMRKMISLLSEADLSSSKRKTVQEFKEDYDCLAEDFDTLAKKYVNDCIDICQKSLKVFERVQTAYQKFKSR